jgi:hypothetical protein
MSRWEIMAQPVMAITTWSEEDLGKVQMIDAKAHIFIIV